MITVNDDSNNKIKVMDEFIFRRVSLVRYMKIKYLNPKSYKMVHSDVIKAPHQYASRFTLESTLKRLPTQTNNAKLM